ncbi:MAG: electron transfer flavoprotein subunit alpha/FixB family protein [Candidatus Marinimicrobia bacterium]|nr:electron transfer flavoprotein subunit alpha/FixB family protein [Candidatus Neomarinimicrobiota bacterium]
MNSNEVWTYIEIHNGKIADVSLELLGKAQDLAKKLSVKCGAILLGENLNTYYEMLFQYGADIIYSAEDSILKKYAPLPYTKTVCEIIEKYEPQIVLYGATVNGRDLAPRIASKLKVGLTADCTELQIGDYEKKQKGKVKKYKNILYQIRPAFGGNIIATIVSPNHRPQMATVRPGVMKINKHDKSNSGKVINIKTDIPQELLITEIIEIIKKEKTVDLNSSSIIVSGGMGVGSKENFQLIHKLAKTLGGVVGASRAAVDAGFINSDHQVGQTGTTVQPKLYIAAGISGQIQHIAGMSNSNRIIAINTDKDAPIFQIANYGIVGDLNEVIPKLIETFKKLKK